MTCPHCGQPSRPRTSPKGRTPRLCAECQPLWSKRWHQAQREANGEQYRADKRIKFRAWRERLRAAEARTP